MNDFKLIKRSVPMKMMLSKYGVKTNGAGFCNCPFHAEKTASCKIYDDHFYCYSCGAIGDVVDFVARKEGITLPEAGQRIVDMFKLRTDKEETPTAKPTLDMAFTIEEKDTIISCVYSALVCYSKLLKLWKIKYRPLMTGTVDKRYVAAIKRIDHVEYMLDEFIRMEKDEAFKLSLMYINDGTVEKIAKLLEEESNYGKD